MKKLTETPGKSPFKVPENYFKDVTCKIISATTGSSNTEVRKGLFNRLKPYLAIAASIMIMLISYTAVKIFTTESRNRKITEISEQELYETYLNDIDLLTLEEQAEYLTPSINIADIKGSEITEYLLLENVNENEIYELL